MTPHADVAGLISRKTAPRDGTEILVLDDEGALTPMVWCSPIGVPGDVFAWTRSDTLSLFYNEAFLGGWMDMPARAD